MTQSDWLQGTRAAYVQALDHALERIRDQLAGIPEVRRAILFGSSASGVRDLFTDLDLIVVMQSDLDFIQRGAELRGRLQAGVDMDLLVYTPEEFERMAGHGFLAHALRTGKVIYEKTAA
jgi:predicted nucleotidyltransferase